MLLKVISYNNENAQDFNYNSMYLNFLLIIFQNKLLEMRELIDAFIPESNYFFLLLTFYKIFVYEPINVSRNAILFFSTILEKVSDKKQREIKDILLKKTLIFYALIRIFLINNNRHHKRCKKHMYIHFPNWQKQQNRMSYPTCIYILF